MRTLTYAEAISEALIISIGQDDNVRILGIGVDYSAGIFGTTREAFLRYGDKYVVDTPAMENALTGIAAGAALVGLKPVVIHARNDFAFLALDQLINVYSKWQYMFDGNAGTIPVITRILIGRGWGQGATHSQSIQSVLAHFPGLRVVMPANPSDAKGMLLAAIRGKDPVIILEHRNLYTYSENVDDEMKAISLEGAQIVRLGSDLTIVAVSICVIEALQAAEIMAGFGLSVEVIDLRSIQPLDTNTIYESVRKTKRILVVDTSWVAFGLSAEILAIIAELSPYPLISPAVRLGQNPHPAPVSKPLEEDFYPTVESICHEILKMFRIEESVNSVNKEFGNASNPY